MSKKQLVIILISLFSLVISVNSVAETSKVAKAQLDKSWGVLLGDLITMTVELPVTANQIDNSSLPHIDKRFGDWLYLREINLTTEQIIIQFQLVNVAPVATDVMTPKLNFRLLNGEFVDIEQLPFTISPVIALTDNEQSTTIKLKPAHAPETIDTSAIAQKLVLAISFAAILLAILIIWSIGWRPRNRRPFAEALHGLRMLRWQHNNDPQQAVRIVHKAFNRTATKTVVHSELSQLFEAAPWLTSLDAEITAFYETSSKHFFSPTSSGMHNLQQLKQLMKACRAKEKLA